MMNKDPALERLLHNNLVWAARTERERPGFFCNLMAQQRPRYMWIGCSDSRVPANQITGLEPGEVFVHRNVANIVVHSDLNALSAIQFAVERLRVEHVMVVGHHGCSGVRAALDGTRIGLADHWIRHVRDVRDRHHDLLALLPPDQQPDALCELNVIEQVANVSASSVVADAWVQGQSVAVHGCVYGLRDGVLRDLEVSVAGVGEFDGKYHAAIAALQARRGSRSVPSSRSAALST